MWERIEPRLRDVARRAGLADVQPAVLLAACVLCVLACAWALWRWWPRDAISDTAISQVAASEGMPGVSAPADEPTSAVTEAELYVHVVGAVRHPGLCELPAGSRVADAIEAAGGMLPDAVAAGVNLARPLTDGEQIVVPDEDDPVTAAAGVRGGPGAGGGATGGPVDINTADAALLDTLPGVGPSTAAKIIAERETNGPFVTADDLGRVSGIGPKRLEQLQGLICVR